MEDDAGNNAGGGIGGEGGIKVQGLGGAVGASKCSADCPGERFRAFCAKRRNDAGDLRVAFCAKIFTRRDARGTNCAGRWVKQRCNRAQPVKLCERRHISTSRALLSTSSKPRSAARSRRAHFFRPREGRSILDARFY